VTLTTADVTGAGGAPLASPTFTGTPGGPTAAPGTSTTQFATTAFVTAAIAAVASPAGKQTIWIPAGAMTANLTSGAAPAQVATTTNAIQLRTLDFVNGSTVLAQFEIGMPKSWDLGTVSFVAVASCGATGAGTAVFYLQGVAIANGANLDAAFGAYQTVSLTGISAGTRLISAESPAITIAGPPTQGAVIVFQISRQASGDSFANTLRLHGIKLFYTTNAPNDA